MARYLVQFERDKCIRAGVCVAVDGGNWVINDNDAKADLIGGVKKGEVWEKEISEGELPAMLDAAKGCPVLVIHITNKETGEKLI